MPIPEITQLMDGKALSRKILAKVAERAHACTIRIGRRPRLAAVLVGSDPATVRYVKMKQASSRTTGIDSLLVHLPMQSSTREVVVEVGALSEDPMVDGILVQHPLPIHVDEGAAFEAIISDKDIDGVTLGSFAAMALGRPGFPSCTPAAILRLLDEYGVEPSGQHAVVIGRSAILGMPVGMLLLGRDATVTFCHSHTTDLPGIVKTADILVSAVGRPRFVRGSWLKPGATVIDAGYSGGVVGDVALDEALLTAGLIAPVPGGVGPMTIALLLEHTVTAAERISRSASL
jgi:methylenetetrahydrofolate dehydrogenase (NADP+)/methenyltetrahydrofolate cyclohydrolase